jgi:hypothetical protein
MATLLTEEEPLKQAGRNADRSDDPQFHCLSLSME